MMEGAPKEEPVNAAGFLPIYKSRLSQQNLAEISKPVEIHNEENILKTREVAPLIDPNPLITVFGPKIDRGENPEEIQQFSEKICARTVSTYPLRSQKQGEQEADRDGDPICDRYGFYLFKNRSIVVVADGCNWGELPKRAAERARNSVMGYLKEKNHKIRCINDAKLYLLRSLNEAHRRICEKVGEEVKFHFQFFFNFFSIFFQFFFNFFCVWVIKNSILAFNSRGHWKYNCHCWINFGNPR